MQQQHDAATTAQQNYNYIRFHNLINHRSQPSWLTRKHTHRNGNSARCICNWATFVKVLQCSIEIPPQGNKHHKRTKLVTAEKVYPQSSGFTSNPLKDWGFWSYEGIKNLHAPSFQLLGALLPHLPPVLGTGSACLALRAGGLWGRLNAQTRWQLGRLLSVSCRAFPEIYQQTKSSRLTFHPA